MGECKYSSSVHYIGTQLGIQGKELLENLRWHIQCLYYVVTDIILGSNLGLWIKLKKWQLDTIAIRYYCEFTLGSAKLSCFIHFNKKKPLFGVYTFYYWTCFKRKAGKNNVFLILSKML